MRIKLESDSPLPVIRAWFYVDAVSTVKDLKHSICSKLPQFSDANIKQQNVILLLDDYELLDSSPADILRDSDTVTYVYYYFSFVKGCLIRLHQFTAKFRTW